MKQSMLAVMAAPLLLGFAQGTPPAANNAETGELPPITKPKIRYMPPPERAGCYYPERGYSVAEETGKGGNEEELECVATAEGQLGECRVISELPKGIGFGTGAKYVAGLIQLEPTDADGAPVAGRKIGLKLSIPFIPMSRMRECHEAPPRRKR